MGLALAALVAFGLGVFSGDDRLRWIGVGMLVASLALRFMHPRR